MAEYALGIRMRGERERDIHTAVERRELHESLGLD